jgi:hypothetical protein
MQISITIGACGYAISKFTCQRAQKKMMLKMIISLMANHATTGENVSK